MTVAQHVIVGMHRSGTSLVARLANLAGLDLGPVDRLMSPSADNPAGFWENLDVVQLNDDLIAHLGGIWSEPPIVQPGWEADAQLDVFYDRARSIIATFPDSVAVGWKDPRGCILLPFWARVAPVESVTMVIRRPDEVALSLHGRDGIDLDAAVGIWLRYTLDVFADAPQVNIVEYDDAMSDPTATMKTLAGTMGLPMPDAAKLAAANEHTDPALRHHSTDANSHGFGELAHDVYQLAKAGSGAHRVLAALGASRRQADYAERERARLAAALESEMIQHRHSEEVRLDTQRTLDEERVSSAAYAESLTEERDRARSVVSDLQRQEQDLRAELRLASERLHAKNSVIDRLEAANRHLAQRDRELRVRPVIEDDG